MLKSNFPKAMAAKKACKPQKMKIKKAASSKLQSGQGPFKKGRKKAIASY